MKGILAFFVILAILVSGCSSDAPANDQTTGAGSSPQRQTNEVPNDTPATDDTPETEEQPASAAQPAVSNANSKLKNILAQTVQYKVTYDVKAAGTTSQMTQYLSGEKIRTDVSAQGVEIRTYLIDKEYTTCNKATGSWMCQKIDYTPSVTDDVKVNVESYDVQSTGTKAVAGVTTDCYRITLKEGTADYCYSPEYVPLYIKTTAGAASSELIAKSYSKSVSDADFNLPAQAGAAINPEDYLDNLPQVG